MTLLDDYEFSYKLLGLPVVNHLLDNAPGELIRRTGINGLLITVRTRRPTHTPVLTSACAQSFKTALSFLRAPETPQLIRSVILTWLKLTEQTTLPASAERLEQLWSLLGEGIIETVWLYGLGEADTIQTSIKVLPDVVRALGVGAARYLKVSRGVPNPVHLPDFSSLSPSCRSLYTPCFPLPRIPQQSRCKSRRSGPSTSS